VVHFEYRRSCNDDFPGAQPYQCENMTACFPLSGFSCLDEAVQLPIGSKPMACIETASLVASRVSQPHQLRARPIFREDKTEGLPQSLGLRSTPFALIHHFDRGGRIAHDVKLSCPGLCKCIAGAPSTSTKPGHLWHRCKN
jgi:hypothetical protein